MIRPQPHYEGVEVRALPDQSQNRVFMDLAVYGDVVMLKPGSVFPKLFQQSWKLSVLSELSLCDVALRLSSIGVNGPNHKEQPPGKKDRKIFAQSCALTLGIL